MKIFLNIFIIFFALIFFASIKTKVDACACIVTPDEGVYCKNKWISKVKILSKRKHRAGKCFFCRKMRYKVKHINKFKMPKNIPKHRIKYIETLDKSGFCGVTHLKIGKEYILTGTIDKKKRLEIELCYSLRFNNKKSEEKIRIWNKYFKCK